ncbi:fibronectin type III domain-containing protein [Streptomyces sp. NBC_00378]|uniref:fibronectin type III domain-containing protein n=1 Tax=Streptomyces sp. NBC_00378 TaxID=2975732 RepID=UPI002259ED31|nr:fibronectin type III domain-containing protein [Streptomyces sp. NBC_00378]MCX5108576.1 fibronectin type III domain-containing protein [Streptomyces sp. NBC_00378]
MRDHVRIVCRAAAVAIALVAAGGSFAVPAVAAPAGITRAAAAPAPTGLAYSFDPATELVTVSWDPKDPGDTVTTGYREGGCSGPSTADGPCFVRASGPLLTGSSFTFRLVAGRTFYFRVYAENAAHQQTGSAILTVTT